jgi:hypothetical protein
MGGSESTPKKEEEKTTEVLTMHPSWESHVNEETNLGIFFSLFNIHISCVLSTLIFCLCIMICILLGYLGYRRFCHRPKRKIREAPSTCATCSSCTAPPAPLTSCPWAMNMEDKYYATMREQDDLNDYGSFYNFAPQRYGQQQPPSHYGQSSCRRFMAHSSHVMTAVKVITVAPSFSAYRSCGKCASTTGDCLSGG